MKLSQNERWERLLTMLNETQSVFQQYMTLLSLEERHLRVLNREGLNEVNSQKEHVLDAMIQTEQRVERELQQLSGTDSYEAFGRFLQMHRDSRAHTASAILTNLMQLAGIIQEQGKKNGAMICGIQERIRMAVTFMYTGLGAGPVYQGSGSLHFPSVPSSVHLQG